MAVSAALGATVIALMVLTAAVMEIVPRLIDGGVAGTTAALLRWPVALFAWYLPHVASYGSIFGALATVVVILTYLDDRRPGRRATRCADPAAAARQRVMSGRYDPLMIRSRRPRTRAGISSSIAEYARR